MSQKEANIFGRGFLTKNRELDISKRISATSQTIAGCSQHLPSIALDFFIYLRPYSAHYMEKGMHILSGYSTGAKSTSVYVLQLDNWSSVFISLFPNMRTAPNLTYINDSLWASVSLGVAPFPVWTNSTSSSSLVSLAILQMQVLSNCRNVLSVENLMKLINLCWPDVSSSLLLTLHFNDINFLFYPVHFFFHLRIIYPWYPE